MIGRTKPFGELDTLAMDQVEKLRRPGESDDDLIRRLIDRQRFRSTDTAMHSLPATSVISDEKVRATAEKIEKVLSGLEPEQARTILEELRNGAIKISDPSAGVPEKFETAFTSEVSKVLQHLRPDQAARYQAAMEMKNGNLMAAIIDERKSEIKKELRDIEDGKDFYSRKGEALEHIRVMNGTATLQRLGETGFHKCAEAIRAGDVITACMGVDDELTEHDVGVQHSFVVQHDWAAAFDKAQDFEGGEFRLPHQKSVFEFRISGSRVCFAVDTEDGRPFVSGLYIETPVGWAIAGLYKFVAGAWVEQQNSNICRPIFLVVSRQVRAISIALEAKLAVTEVVRAPHKLNRARAKRGKLPIFDYHVIDLANRKHYLPREAEPGDIEVEHARRRLHFVRGHTRHYPNHKVWIKWHLRGDPDLGFIDKHYRL